MPCSWNYTYRGQSIILCNKGNPSSNKEFKHMTADLFQDYRSAEVTLFWVGNNDTGDSCLVFAATELIPENQLPSVSLGSGENAYLSHRLSKKAKIYCKRFFCSVTEALDCYEKMDWSLLDATLSLQIENDMKREPQSGYALVIPRSHVIIGHEASNLSRVLPNRETSLRACAFMETDDALHKRFTKGERSGIVRFVQRYCGVDLEAYGEFLGANILCMQDPLLWGIKSFGTDRNGNLDLLLLPRDGKSPIGMRYMLCTQHSFGVANAELEEVNSEIISIPWSDDKTEPELYLWDKNGVLLEVKTLSFIGAGSVRTTTEHRTLPNGISLPVFPRQRNRRSKKQKDLMELYEEQRMYRRLEDKGEFFYFTAGASKRAIDIIGMLIARTDGEITICDMYLDATGLERMVSGWIKCRKLTLFTSKYWMKANGGANETDLINSIQKLYDEKRVDQILLYRLAGGSHDKGSVHDRFLILDETAYCLGSSLNGFGTKDTVLFRSPNPDAFKKRVKAWENNYEPKVWGVIE